MKKYYVWGLYILASGLGPFAGKAAESTVVERGPNHLIWNIENEKGDRPRSIVVLETGMNRWNAETKKWEISPAEIKSSLDGAVANFGQYSVAFAPNLNVLNAIKVILPDGGQLKGGVIGLAYRHIDQYVVIANLQDCEGEIIGNEVVYRDVFKEISADVRYVLTKASFEQFIVIHEHLLSPEDYGLPVNSVLEVITEFNDPPDPQRMSELVQAELPSGNQSAGRPGILDEKLDFGSMLMPDGIAFCVGMRETADNVRVAKNWVQINGRYLLFEQVEWPKVAAMSERLPAGRRAAQLLLNKAALHARVAKTRGIPSLKRSAAIKQPMRMAQVDSFRDKPALVLDYQLLAAASNFTFQADTTYYISGSVSLYGTTVFEGGTVLKYAPTNNPILNFYGGIDCKTSAYRPAIFTARDDSTVGEAIPGAGALSGYYAATAVYVFGTHAGSVRLHDIRLSYAQVGLNFSYSVSNRVDNVQIVNCGTGIRSSIAQYSLRNVLIYNVTNAFWGDGSMYSSTTTGHLEHVTFDQIQYLSKNTDIRLRLTNCLLANVTNTVSYDGASNAVVSGTNVFKTVGAGAHYLVDSSPYRDAGTTNISAAVAVDLRSRTTYPPVVFSPAGVYSGLSQTLSPVAQRDTDRPDLGYHYAAIDHAIGPTLLTNATIQVNAGTVLAGFSQSNGMYYMLGLGNGAKLYADGRADAKITFTRYNTVQEMANTNWAGPLASLIYNWYGYTVAPEFRGRFMDFSVLAGEMKLLDAANATGPETWYCTDCQFSSGGVNADWGPALVFTNCLFNRVALSAFSDSAGTNSFHNCTYYGGSFAAGWVAPAIISFTDNLFAGTYIESYGEFTNSNIGYTTNCIGRLEVTNLNDVILPSLTFQSGSLGYFYILTNCALLNAGSRNATNAGLYHYTMTTNQVKETNSIVDIGFHYVAVSTNGVPLDYDGDGIPDYWEDTNGNGSVDPGETDWQSATDLGFRVFITRPR